MLRRARTVKPKAKKKAPERFTLEWLDQLDTLYNRNESWPI